MKQNKISEEMFARGGGGKTNKEPINKGDNKRKIITVIYSLVIVLLLIGVSFALYNYNFLGNLNLIKNESIELEFLESTNEVISIKNAIPISDSVGMNGSDYFAFQVRTKTKNQMSIGYNLKIEKLSASSGYTLLNDNQVKIYLTDYEEKGLIKPTLVSDLDNYIIYKKYHNHNVENEEVISKYKLRVWIDENVTGEGWTQDTKIQYSFKIGVGSAENKTYKVIFNSNTDKEEVKTQYIGYNESLALEKNSFTKEGYRFIGWSTTKGGEVIYQDREKVTNLSGNNESITLYAVWQRAIFDVNVVVQNGIIDDEATKQVKENQNITFALSPNSIDAPGTVSCTNNQTGRLINNQLTVLNVTKDTVCTVVYNKDTTVLYNDGTLIINELARDREDNIEKHGTVTKEYEAMTNSNSYVMTSASSQPWVNERTSIKDVELGQEISPVSTAYWFREARNMETGDFTKLNTSEVTNMYGMFYNVGYNKTTFDLIGLDSWDTSKVENMGSMFYGFASKADALSIDLSSWNVSNVTNITSMFNNFCLYGVKECNLNLSNWNLLKATNLSYMFYNSGRDVIEYKIDLSNWNTPKATDMRYMFMYSAGGLNSKVFQLKGLDTWNVSNVNNMGSMFEVAGQYVTDFTIGDLSSWDTSKVTDMSRMLYYAGGNAVEFNIGNIGKWNTSQVTNMNRMFDGAGIHAITWNIGDLSKWDVSNVTDMGVMFAFAGANAETFDIGDLSNWNTSKVTNMERMFEETGIHATTFKSIGKLNIPTNCNVNNFAYATNVSAGSRKFTGNLVINGSLSNYENMLRDTATYSSARINLYYKNVESEKIVDELISLYGPNGTVSKGNIYKVTE